MENNLKRYQQIHYQQRASQAVMGMPSMFATSDYSNQTKMCTKIKTIFQEPSGRAVADLEGVRPAITYICF